MRNIYIKFWFGSLKGRAYLEDIVIEGSIILKWILRTYDGYGSYSSGLGQVLVVVSCENVNQSKSSIRSMKFFIR